MTSWLKISLLSLSLFSFGASACDIHGHTGFAPENSLRIPVGQKALGGISDVQFNKVMDRVSALFTSAVEATGKKFVIERRWTDENVNAYAHQQTPGVDTIVMFGGLARHIETTEDAMALVACHELGHHLGGAPKKAGVQQMWASNEGQADYWGSMKCLRHYFEQDDNVTIVSKMTIPANVLSNCQLVYKNANEIALCERSAMAGLATAKLLNAIMQGKTPVSFVTPDTSVVAQTNDQHPHAQCRLDTYFQASLCDHGFSELVSSTDANTGVCSLRNGDTVGNRPVCWYKP